MGLKTLNIFNAIINSLFEVFNSEKPPKKLRDKNFY